MPRRRRRFDAAFKAKVAVDAIRELRTTSEIAQQFQVHPNQVTLWKKQLLAQAAEVFEAGAAKSAQSDEPEAAELYEQIGRLKVELEWLKKKLPSTREESLKWIEPGHPRLSVRRQCALLDAAFEQDRPEIFNTDQGAQFTSREFTQRLHSASIAISMDGAGRALDNVFIERLWRSVKYEDIYLKEYDSGADCQRGLGSYFKFYCHERPHQGLDYRTPWEVHHRSRSASRRST